VQPRVAEPFEKRAPSPFFSFCVGQTGSSFISHPPLYEHLFSTPPDGDSCQLSGVAGGGDSPSLAVLLLYREPSLRFIDVASFLLRALLLKLISVTLYFFLNKVVDFFLSFSKVLSYRVLKSKETRQSFRRPSLTIFWIKKDRVHPSTFLLVPRWLPPPGSFTPFEEPSDSVSPPRSSRAPQILPNRSEPYDRSVLFDTGLNRSMSRTVKFSEHTLALAPLLITSPPVCFRKVQLSIIFVFNP